MRKGLFVLFGIFAGGAIALDHIQPSHKLRGAMKSVGQNEETSDNILETSPIITQFNELAATAVSLKQTEPRNNAIKFFSYATRGFETTAQALELEINPRLKTAFNILVTTNAIEGMNHSEKLDAMIFCHQFAGNPGFPSYNNDEVLAIAKKLLKNYKEFTSDKHNLSQKEDFEQYKDAANGLESKIQAQQEINKEVDNSLKVFFKAIAT